MAEGGKDATDRRTGDDRRTVDRRKRDDQSQIPPEGDRRKDKRRLGDRRQ